MKVKPKKILGVSLFITLIIIALIGFLYMFLGFAGEDFINERILGKVPIKTEIIQVSPQQNKLTSVAKYSITFPSNYKVTQDKILSTNPFTILKNQSINGEIYVNRSKPSGDGKSLDSVLSAHNWILFDTERLDIKGNEAIKGRDSQDGHLYAILIKSEVTEDHPWLYWISTQDKNLISDLDQIAKSFEYIPD